MPDETNEEFRLRLRPSRPIERQKVCDDLSRELMAAKNSGNQKQAC
jgi:hypothetical protein